MKKELKRIIRAFAAYHDGPRLLDLARDEKVEIVLAPELPPDIRGDFTRAAARIRLNPAAINPPRVLAHELRHLEQVVVLGLDGPGEPHEITPKASLAADCLAVMEGDARAYDTLFAMIQGGERVEDASQERRRNFFDYLAGPFRHSYMGDFFKEFFNAQIATGTPAPARIDTTDLYKMVADYMPDETQFWASFHATPYCGASDRAVISLMDDFAAEADPAERRRLAAYIDYRINRQSSFEI